MDKLVLFNTTTLNKLLNKRSGESKFGEHVQMLTSISNIYEQLKNLDVTHVILGLPEDVGVFANYEKTGTSRAWERFIKILLNINNNEFTKANSVLILGHLDFTSELLKASKLSQSKKKDIAKTRNIVSEIDTYVSHIVHQIISAGKKPIIIGGGQNNAYGNVKGSSLVFGKAINAINFDMRADFEPEDGRHNGNGFSYAYAEGFLEKCFVFGLHENKTSEKLFKTLKKLKSVKYNTFEAIAIRKETKFKAEMQLALEHIENKPFGIEIDCKAIEDINSSSKTKSGFSLNKTRKFLNFFSKHENASYLHICEALPSKKSTAKFDKLMTCLVTDFINHK